ncbi:Menaquinol-cytochrome c reductase cytochrome b subunit [Maioricimonas rarisocia]|uniref:Menaquinol-cytochrome c reductase cytochrome b subunit n=1 Tax=Maioricimonas rarisocia TaxID=2528026 RepID=A0A517Z9X8_9PLAN|nr:cytochrome b N-terminal domain-containing protein [Maioricimonas rarisocia]QDU39283.1 Menaquinol-cytochrome c reductase cytochrome b subunit [Maioricimonas rarisocia]
MNRFIDWLDDRTGIKNIIHGSLFEPVPGGARWRYVWGSTLVFTFFLQVVTGICLWMAYSPSAQTAWESVYYIQYEMTLGWLIRGLHHFAAQAMVILLVFHLVQVVIDGAYKAPREVNFWLGLILMQIVLGLGLTGYLLPWDQKGYYATQVATEIMRAAPVAGPYIQKLVQGGSEYGHHTLTRFFALHAGILPGLLVGFLVLHLAIFRRHGVHAKDPDRAPAAPFWPDQVLRDAVACLAVLAGLLGLVLWKGSELSAPANPGEPFSAARPEWYYLFLFRFLKFEWVEHLGLAFGAIYLPGILMLILVLMPLIAKIRGGHAFNVVYLWLVLAGAGGLTGLALYEDWYQDDEDSRDFRAAVATAHRDGKRAVALAHSPSGIPPEGAITLLRNDPLTQGPKLFRNYCIDCHQPEDGEFEIPPQAPMLASLDARGPVYFGSRDWIRKVLTDFANHFAPLANIEGERAEAAELILEGSMAEWSSANGPLLNEPANADDFEALVEFLYAQSMRSDASPPDDPRVIRGREIFETGALTQGEFDSACIDCHAMHVVGEEEPLSEDMQPILTNYGGNDWLRAFIADPQSHYAGEYGNNAMPAFAGQLSPHDIDMLARWMTGDYYLPPEGDAATH